MKATDLFYDRNGNLLIDGMRVRLFYSEISIDKYQQLKVKENNFCHATVYVDNDGVYDLIDDCGIAKDEWFDNAEGNKLLDVEICD